MDESYKQDPTYQLAMMRLGAHHAKKILEENSSQATCPIDNVTAEQRERFMEGRKAARDLLHTKESESQARPQEAASPAQASGSARVTTTIPQAAAHTTLVGQGTDSKGERQVIAKEGGGIVPCTGPIDPAVKAIYRNHSLRQRLQGYALAVRPLLPRL